MKALNEDEELLSAYVRAKVFKEESLWKEFNLKAGRAAELLWFTHKVYWSGKELYFYSYSLRSTMLSKSRCLF